MLPTIVPREVLRDAEALDRIFAIADARVLIWGDLYPVRAAAWRRFRAIFGPVAAEIRRELGSHAP
jgi:hypothetical protein